MGLIMKRFEYRQVKDALAHAAAGGQALHVFSADTWPGPAPAIFRRYKTWAHLIDDDEERLRRTAKTLGVRKIVVGRRGAHGQHVDLCAGPLQRALALCEPSSEQTTSTSEDLK